MLNPLSAPLSLIGVFHPNFSAIHQQASLLLGQPKALVCKGEGGEFERIPDRAVELYGVDAGQAWQANWDIMLKPGQEVKPERLNLNHFRAVWDGEAVDSYGEKAVIGTLALVIRALGLETREDAALQLGLAWWRDRHQFDMVREAV